MKMLRIWLRLDQLTRQINPSPITGRAALVLALVAAAGCGCNIEVFSRIANSNDAVVRQGERRVNFFISIDGIQPDLATTLSEHGQLSAPKGLGWLLVGSAVSRAAEPLVTPITAASHASTITCSPPSRHGIIANAYLKHGQIANGFSEEFATEPLWRAAMRQGQHVLSLGYVGTDGTSEARRADYGLAYPLDRLMAPPKTLTFTAGDLAVAGGWTAPESLGSMVGAREISFDVVLNPITHESRRIYVLVLGASGDRPVLYAADSKDLSLAPLAALQTDDPGSSFADIFFTEASPESTVLGTKRRVTLRASRGTTGQISLYVSRPSYNQAYPEAFRQKLDHLNLVWPDYGIKDAIIPVTALQWVESQAMIDRFLADVAVQMLPELAVDIVLFYQPLIDSLGHRSQSQLPRPFNPANADDVSKAFVSSFHIIDQNLSRMLVAAEASHGGLGNIFLMGDHGMDGIVKVVNVAHLLPKDHGAKVEVFSSGDLILIYPKAGTAAGTAELVAADLRQKLGETIYQGSPVLGFSAKRADFAASVPAADYRREWPYGEAVAAFAGVSGLWLRYLPLDANLLLEPTALGMHGKMVMATDSRTLFIAKGAHIPEQELGPINLVDAVPTFTKQLGITPPRDCVGKDLFN